MDSEKSSRLLGSAPPAQILLVLDTGKRIQGTVYLDWRRNRFYRAWVKEKIKFLGKKGKEKIINVILDGNFRLRRV